MIKFRPNILVEIKGEEAWVLDTTTQDVFQLPGAAAEIIKVLSAAPAVGISLDQLQLELPKYRRAAVLSVLSEFQASRLIEGFTPPARRAAAKPASLIIGAFSLGAGVMLSPAPAHAMNCIGPPSCTVQGGTCTHLGGWVCVFGDGYPACDAGCS